MKVTSKKIAEFANVSRGTVDRVINKRPGVSPKTRERVEAIIEALNYQPNIIGKSLVKINTEERFGFILTPDYNPFVWDIEKGIRDAEEELKAFGVSAEVRMLKSLDVEEQSQMIDEMVAQKISGIAMIPLVSDVIAQKIDSLSSCDFPIITFNSQINSKNQICFVGQDHYKGGICAANLMSRLLTREAKVGIIISSHYLDCHINRLKGFKDRLSHKNNSISIVNIYENQDMDEKAYAYTIDLVKEHPNLDGIYITGGGVVGVVNALKHLERKDIRLICHDYLKDTKRFLEEGYIDFAIGQKPQKTGALLLQVLFDCKNKARVEIPKIIEIPLEIATEDIINGSTEHDSYTNFYTL